MPRTIGTMTAAILLTCAAAALAGPSLEIAAGLFTPVRQEVDILRSGAELSVGLSAPVNEAARVCFSGGYARLGTVDSVVLLPEEGFWPEVTGSPEDWTIVNVSCDARVGWDLAGDRPLWAGVGVGWYHVMAGEVAEHGSDRIWRSKSADAPGLRLALGGSLPLGEATRLGLTARYLVVNAATVHWDYDLTAVQVQAVLAIDL
jgi:hypothetical protein